jgi:hypothetical protein
MPPEDMTGAADFGQPEGVVRLAQRHPCLGCGYDLVGLDIEGVCPECGLRVMVSLNAMRSWMSDPVVLHRLRRGMGVMIAAAGTAAVAGMAMMVSPASAGAAIVAMVAALAVWMAGAWWITTRTESFARTEAEKAGLMSRVGVVGLVGSVGLTVLLAVSLGGNWCAWGCVSLGGVMIFGAMTLGGPLAFASQLAKDGRSRGAEVWCTLASMAGVLVAFGCPCVAGRLAPAGVVAFAVMAVVGLELTRAGLSDERSLGDGG